MKRKFSFNLAHAKTPAKPETQEKPAPEPVAAKSQSSSRSHSHSHKRSGSKDSISDYSPYINRRVLDAQTDQELRAACRLILQNFKPSDHGMENTDPKLDFGGLRQRKASRAAHAAEVAVRVPTGAPVDPSAHVVARKPSKTRTRTKADNEIRARTQADLPVRANSSRKRADFAWLDDRDDKRDQNLKKFGRGASVDLPRPAATQSGGDSGVATPVTVASTLAYSKVASTAPTSASLPSEKSSKRRSRQLENPAAVADAAAAEWMRQELERKMQHDGSQTDAQTSIGARPPSRSASIRNGIKGFPGTLSRSLSRAASTDSLRTADSQASSQDLHRSGSGIGWRSWGLRRSSSRNNSRPGTSKGPADEPEPSTKNEPKAVNLNRELPPLPSLDTWKDSWPELAQPKEETAKSPITPISPTHIASLMRPQEVQDYHQYRSPAAPRQHRRSGSDSLAMQYANAYPVRKSSRAVPELNAAPKIRRAAPDSPIAIEPVTTGWSSTSNLGSRHDMGSSTHTRQRSGASLTSPSSPAGKLSFEVPADTSRKASAEAPASDAFAHEVKLSKKEEQKSKLKKVFSGWMTKKAKKDDWMHRIEKEGVKEGVLVEEPNTTAPVVRY